MEDAQGKESGVTTHHGTPNTSTISGMYNISVNVSWVNKQVVKNGLGRISVKEKQILLGHGVG